VNAPPDGEIAFIGIIPSPESDQTLTAGPGYWNSCANSQQLLAQREWDTGNHDEILARDRLAKERQLAESKRAAEARANRVKGMTLAQLAEQPFLRRWSDLKPRTAVAKARAIIRNTVTSLIALGARPSKASVLKKLRKMIEAFNQLQKEYEFIETSERDDICEHLGEALLVLGLKEDPALLFEEWEDL
jgi:hypothetical protein